MGVRLLIRRARTVFSRMAASDAASSTDIPPPADGIQPSKIDPATDTELQQADMPGEDLQHGVRDIEAITLTWSKTTLALVFIK